MGMLKTGAGVNKTDDERKIIELIRDKVFKFIEPYPNPGPSSWDHMLFCKDTYYDANINPLSLIMVCCETNSVHFNDYKFRCLEVTDHGEYEEFLFRGRGYDGKEFSLPFYFHKKSES